MELYMKLYIYHYRQIHEPEKLLRTNERQILA